MKKFYIIAKEQISRHGVLVTDILSLNALDSIRISNVVTTSSEYTKKDYITFFRRSLAKVYPKFRPVTFEFVEVE